MSLITAQISQLRQAITAAHGTFPKPVAQALADADKLRTLARDTPAPTADQLADAAATALLAGRDPLTDPDVQRLLAARHLNGGGHGLAYLVNQAAEARTLTALEQHVDAIVDTLRTGCATAAQHLTDAHDVLGDLALDDTHAIVRLGNNAAELWVNAREAAQTIRVIDSGWVALANLTRFASTGTPATLRLAEVSLDQYEQLGRRADPWAIIRAGATIDLATATTVHERTERLERERQQRQASQPTFRDAARRRLGIGRVIITT